MRPFTTNAIKMSQRVCHLQAHLPNRKTNIIFHKIQFKVTGKVQGVCFRAFTADKAESLKLTGHVKNEKDGSVC
jgi:hypothetical protein